MANNFDVFDAELQNHFSIHLLYLHSDAARAWVRDNVGDHATRDVQFFGGALVIEPRYVGSIVEGMEEAGLTVDR